MRARTARGALAAVLAAVLLLVGAPAAQAAPSTLDARFAFNDERVTVRGSLTSGGAALAGEPIQSILSHAPGNDQAIGGLKVMTENGWFAARPSGTEDIYKIYAESFVSDEHLKLLVAEAQTLVDGAISSK